MLTRAGHPLPAEIYRLIYIYLDQRDLAHLSIVSRLLFFLTVPYVWREAHLTALLKLLPRTYTKALDAETLQILRPLTLSDEYFSRFHFYGEHVEHLNAYLPQKSSFSAWTWLESDRDWLISHASSHSILPRLKTADITGPRESGPTECRDWQLWMQVLLPDNLKILSFRRSRQKENDSVAIQCFLQRFASLERLELRVGEADSYDRDFWRAPKEIQSYSIPIKELYIERPLIGMDNFIWMSKLPNLQNLHLLDVSVEDSTQIDALRDKASTDISPSSFTTLQSLMIHATDSLASRLLLQIWRTPLVTNLIRVTITTSWYMLDELGQFLEVLAIQSTNISQLAIREPGSRNNGLTASMATLNKLKNLRLTHFTLGRKIARNQRRSVLAAIGELWPDLQQLDLQYQVVEIDELSMVSNYMPKLQSLRISIPSDKHNPHSLGYTAEENQATSIIPLGSLSLNKLLISFDSLRLTEVYGSDDSDGSDSEVTVGTAKTGRFDYDDDDISIIARNLLGLSKTVELIPIWEWTESPVEAKLRSHLKQLSDP